MKLLLTTLICLPLTALAQEPGVQELQQKEYSKELSTDVYDQVLDRLELEEERRSKSDQKTDTTTQASPKIVTELGVVYVGMPKEDLAKIGYDELTQKGYRKEGDEEWITYLNWSNLEKDLVTFYIVDGKVKDWKEE